MDDSSSLKSLQTLEKKLSGAVRLLCVLIFLLCEVLQGIYSGFQFFLMVYHRGNGRGGRRWFTIEAKSYEISVEGARRRKQFFITEKSKGVISWIRFGEESLSSLLNGVNECRRKKVSDRWRLEWKEEK